MINCIFCRIVDGRAPGYIIDETDRVLVFLSLENHPLVVPRAHIPDILALDDATAAAVMQEAVTIARAVKRGLPCDGIYLTQANGEAAGQDVFHFHLHVYPRWHGDRRPNILPEVVANDVRQQTHARLVAALAEIRAGSPEARP